MSNNKGFETIEVNGSEESVESWSFPVEVAQLGDREFLRWPVMGLVMPDGFVLPVVGQTGRRSDGEFVGAAGAASNVLDRPQPGRPGSGNFTRRFIRGQIFTSSPGFSEEQRARYMRKRRYIALKRDSQGQYWELEFGAFPLGRALNPTDQDELREEFSKAVESGEHQSGLRIIVGRDIAPSQSQAARELAGQLAEFCGGWMFAKLRERGWEYRPWNRQSGSSRKGALDTSSMFGDMEVPDIDDTGVGGEQPFIS